jgi:DNA-binding CsgD family transcriptional regulator
MRHSQEKNLGKRTVKSYLGSVKKLGNQTRNKAVDGDQ